MDDMRNPTWLTMQGVELVIGISGDPGRGWQKVVATSQFAGVYGIGANQIGANSGNYFIGNSGFVRPSGALISAAGFYGEPNVEGIYYAELPLQYTPQYFLPFITILLGGIFPGPIQGTAS
jgi:predicted amidohydrolase